MSDTKTQLKRSPTLFDMPLDVVELILEKMYPMDLLVVRKVNRSLRKAVEKFGIRFDKIYLSLHDKEVRIRLEVNEEYAKKIEYKEADGCTVGTVVVHNTYVHTPVLKYIDKDQFQIEGENFMEMAFNDLKILWKHVSHFAIDDDRYKNGAANFIDFMKSENPVHVNLLSIDSFSSDDVLDILTLFDAETLKIIQFMPLEQKSERLSDQLQRIGDVKQWKNAEILRLWCDDTFESELLNNFFHFSSFEVYMMSDFSTQIAIQIRDDLMRRSTFHGCIIKSESSHTDPIQIAKVFEPEYAGGNSFFLNYEHPNDDYMFHFKCTNLDSHFLFHIQKCMPQFDVSIPYLKACSDCWE